MLIMPTGSGPVRSDPPTARRPRAPGYHPCPPRTMSTRDDPTLDTRAGSALTALLVAERGALERLVAVEAGDPLRRYESVSDLVQGIHLRALERAHRYEDRGPAAGAAWLRTLARNHLDNRRRHWRALKRGSGRVLRLERSQDGSAGGVDPVTSSAGPSTFASLREDVERATLALGLLLERDRRILLLASRGLVAREIAEELGIGAEAAERARGRALDRFRQAWRVTLRAGR